MSKQYFEINDTFYPQIKRPRVNNNCVNTFWKYQSNNLQI